ncbi:hypothetical protein K402DRAFT_105468 [Aulographum hederae CBS 113979]|uniref:RanBD1 domain-containing protein n=1 Tax=Aulographum hederae CBS 113979 TaxID=1176131 RepID=A0A6G1GY02_9PEZI|nr:hypothetical protein K402DRAFT_105468 [Aulographum hederae CBS 113979]
MSKRGAANQLTKDGPVGPEEEQQPQRATAAQIAARKIKSASSLRRRNPGASSQVPFPNFGAPTGQEQGQGQKMVDDHRAQSATKDASALSAGSAPNASDASKPAVSSASIFSNLPKPSPSPSNIFGGLPKPATPGPSSLFAASKSFGATASTTPKPNENAAPASSSLFGDLPKPNNAAANPSSSSLFGNLPKPAPSSTLFGGLTAPKPASAKDVDSGASESASNVFAAPKLNGNTTGAPAQPSGFKPSGVVSGSGFLGQFGQRATADDAKEKAKRRAEEFDSEDSDANEEEYNREKKEEADRKKKEIEEQTKALKIPAFAIPTGGFSFGGAKASPTPTPKSTASTPSATPSLFGNAAATSTPAGQFSFPGAAATPKPGDSNTPKDAQRDLIGQAAAKEGHDVLFEAARSRAQKLVAGKWEKQGTGPIMVLRNKESGYVSIWMKVDPLGKFVINTRANKEFKYEAAGKVVRFPIITKEAGVEQWVVQFGEESAAKEMSGQLTGALA